IPCSVGGPRLRDDARREGRRRETKPRQFASSARTVASGRISAYELLRTVVRTACGPTPEKRCHHTSGARERSSVAGFVKSNSGCNCGNGSSDGGASKFCEAKRCREPALQSRATRTRP